MDGMKHTGMTRPVDELGRIVIPKELRSSLDIRATDRMEFWMTEEGMVLRKAVERCAVCGGVHGDMLDVDGMKFCRVCAGKISKKLGTE